MKTKEKILHVSLELFNRSGIAPVTTNHISKAMDISPGNLYFHYRNKEEILVELFKSMCKETYSIWQPRKSAKKNIIPFVDENFELYWKYRFFHREMYSLRRKDPQLSRIWRTHIQKMMKLMNILYRHWVKSGVIVSLDDREEMIFICESLLAMSTTYLQFFESAEKNVGKKSLDRGRRHVARLILPYTQEKGRQELTHFLQTK